MRKVFGWLIIIVLTFCFFFVFYLLEGWWGVGVMFGIMAFAVVFGLIVALAINLITEE